VPVHNIAQAPKFLSGIETLFVSHGASEPYESWYSWFRRNNYWRHGQNRCARSRRSINI